MDGRFVNCLVKNFGVRFALFVLLLPAFFSGLASRAWY
jgi:hypothetical protein